MFTSPPKPSPNPYMEVTPPHDGRYEFHSASMIDLIQAAYGFGFDRILGGPSWLEMDRFEVIAKVPAGTSMATPPASPQGTLPDAVKEMLQSVLADRLKLVIRQETRPLPGYALIVEKKAADERGRWIGQHRLQIVPPTAAGGHADPIFMQEHEHGSVCRFSARAGGQSRGG